MQRPASCEKSYHVQSKSRTAFITCQNITNKRQENNMVANQERVAKKRAKIFPNLGQCPRNNVSKGLITWRVFSPVDRPEISAQAETFVIARDISSRGRAEISALSTGLKTLHVISTQG